jgi:DNA repair photolyase
MRWHLADEERDGQPALFGVDELVGPQRGTGALSHLEFLHVAAKRILNQVPVQSQMPFRWTINVYRGCSHACTYCLAGDTGILMVNGTTRRLRDIQVGDQVYGTRSDRNGRRYVPTAVSAHWRTSKPAYRITLTDGTTLTASSDHRFLTDAGWAYVSGTRANRRYLSPGDELLGVWESRARITSIEATGKTQAMYDITTGTGDFIANGVISHNCFARPTHDYLGLGIGEDFDRKIVVKINAVEKLRAELADPSWTGEGVAMGTNTDPYQRCEGKYKLTRGVVEALTEHGNPFSILTKSALVLRDLDLIERAAQTTDVTVNFSIGTLDERVWRLTEPGTPNPRRRVEAMRTLAARGIRTGALIAPILPGLSDRREQLREVVDAITASGGRILGTVPLHLRPGTREHFLDWLAEQDSELHTRYLRAYRGRSYLDPSYGRWLNETLQQLTDDADAKAPNSDKPPRGPLHQN